MGVNAADLRKSAGQVHLLQVYSKLYEPSKSVHKLLTAIAGSFPRGTEVDAGTSRRAKQLRDNELDLLVARYKECRNMRVVAREFRMSRDTVAKHLASRGIDTSRGMKPSEIKQAKELYTQGMGSGRIGRMLGFDNKTILQELRQQGVMIRSGPNRS